MRQRLALARLDLARPSLLLLDEPLAGLDQQGGKILSRYLAAFRAGGGSVLMATHRLSQAWELADRVVILVEGRVALEASTKTMDMIDLERRYRAATEVLP